MKSIVLVLFLFTFGAYANEENGDAIGFRESKLDAQWTDSEITKDFSGYSLIEAVPNTKENVELLREMDAKIDEDALDFWSDPTAIDTPVEILVHPELNKRTEQLFRERNITLRVVSKNFAEMIEEEKLELAIEEENFIWSLRATSGQSQGQNPFDLYSYNSLRAMNDHLSHLAQNTANYNPVKGLNVNVRSIGTTHEGRPINMLTISLKNGKNKAAVWLDCGVHSRERVSPAFCMYAIDQLIRQPQEVLSMYDFYIVPVLNPDGYYYMNHGNRMWRKNRRPSSTPRSSSPSIRSERQFGGWGQQFQGVMQGFPGSSSPQQVGGGFPGSFPSNPPSQGASQWPGSNNKCTGTDVNRNFDMDWATVGSSRDPCQDTFHGSSPFSERESTALKDAINTIGRTQTIAAYVSVHSYSQLWMTPYGSKKSLSRHNTDLKRVAQRAVTALSSMYGTQYEYGPIATIIYKAAGSSVDWAHENVSFFSELL